MADTTLLLNGFSVIGDPQTNSNASNGGEFMIHDGTAVFEDDDIIVFEVEGVLPKGSKKRKPVFEAMLDSVEVTPYEHDTRHVDWNAGWTLDLPQGFTRKATPKRAPRFECDVGYLDAQHRGGRAEHLWPLSRSWRPGGRTCCAPSR